MQIQQFYQTLSPFPPNPAIVLSMRIPSLALCLPALAAATFLASCGYSPLYAPGAGATSAAGKVQVGTVDVQQESKNVGQRRTAQTVAQELKLNFPNTGMQMDTLEVHMEETVSTLAVQRTAAVQRAQIDLTGTLTLTNPDGARLLYTQLTATAPYNVESTPYSTESGKTYARITAAKNLADEISRRIYLYYSTHKNTGVKAVPAAVKAEEAAIAPTPEVIRPDPFSPNL